MTKDIDAFSIRQVVDLTGLSEFTVRGWENRYGAFQPRRTPTGRRVYSANDLQRGILLRELTRRDHKIGEIAKLSTNVLQRLLAENERAPKIHQPPGRFQEEIGRLLGALSLQKWDLIGSELRKISRNDKPRVILAEFIAPLVQELGRLVAAGMISVSQEHIFSALLKERLYVLQETARKRTRASRFLIAAPEGDFHELGILIAHTMAVQSGLTSVYVGANSPKKDLCETALRFGASHVVVGSTVSRREGAKEDLYSYFHFLDQHLGRDVAVWLGGRNASGGILESSRKVIFFTSLLEFDKALQLID